VIIHLLQITQRSPFFKSIHLNQAWEKVLLPKPRPSSGRAEIHVQAVTALLEADLEEAEPLLLLRILSKSEGAEPAKWLVLGCNDLRSENKSAQISKPAEV
jgi:hypothetical protein